jgi:EpsI family protein
MREHRMSKQARRFAFVVGLLLLTSLAANYLHWSDSSYQGPVRLEEIPKSIGPWSGEDKFFRDDLYPELGADATLLRLYSHVDAPRAVWFYLGYTRNIRDYNMGPHSPKVCYPAQGWKIVRETVVPVAVGNGSPRTIHINEMAIKNGRQRRLVYYWFQSRDKTILSTFRQNYYAFWDKIFRNRSDVALVRVSLPANGVEAADAKAAKGFIRELFPHLLKAIPQ